MRQSVQGGQMRLPGTGRAALPQNPPLPTFASASALSLLLSPSQQGHFPVARNPSKGTNHYGHEQLAPWTCVGSPLHVWAHASPYPGSRRPRSLLAHDMTQAQPSP